jgi:sterol desaturase/sphingolipid hydroxylase (fatty acid hydroxylase superfamily)
MDAFFLGHEATLRSAAFFGALGVVALWEVLAPRRALTASKPVRWFGNLTVSVLNTFLVRLVFPGLTVGMALLAGERGWGFFNAVALPYWVAFALALIVLDLVFYVEHRLLHRVPLLWRFHRMHHADPDYDLTTGLRFHPFESLVFNGTNMALVAVLGLPVGAVILFEVLAGAQSSLSHGNIRLTLSTDRALRLVLVTPDMHRVHHSTVPQETDSNFGNLLPLWDRLVGTYRAEPAAGHEGMQVGLGEFRDRRYLRLHWMLALPFLSVGTGLEPARRR